MLATPTTIALPTRNLIVDYYDVIAAAAQLCGATAAGPAGTPHFAPGFTLPRLEDRALRFFEAATAVWRELGEHAGHRLQMLDLTQNPGTQTTKTFASMLIVARAVEHIRTTGEAVCLFTPTSANKGIALRDAVARAYAAGLATPEQLSIVVLAPASTREKFRRDALAADPALRRLNPLLCLPSGQPEAVKALGRAFVDEYAADAHHKHGVNLWYSLALNNYLVADSARAAFEADVAAPAAPRWHAHSVSSAFGLLGYNLGREVLEGSGAADVSTRPGFLLVQHLGTPDMVLSLRHGSFSRDNLPAYRRDESGGGWVQETDPHYPAVTDDPAEVLDPTFYTHSPVTSPAMNDLIGRFGGDGIVVSRRECVARYPVLRRLFAGLPEDPAQLREWSLVMALTGVLNAIDRGLVPSGYDIVVHGSGSYTVQDYAPHAADAQVATTADIATAIFGGR